MTEMRNAAKIALMYLAWAIFTIRKAITPHRIEPPRRICVLYLSGLGDILCDTPFYTALRNNYPNSELTACFPAAMIGVQKRFFAFDKYIAHQSYTRTLGEINRARFDLVVIPGWLLRNSLLALLSNAGSILGYINDLSFTNRYLNSFMVESVGMAPGEFSQDMRRCHLAERPNAIAAALGMPGVDAAKVELPRKKDPANIAVVHAGARFPGRRWNEQGFAKVINWMVEKAGISEVYLIGDGMDRESNTRIMAGTNSIKVINVAGEMNLEGTCDLIATARIFLGNDSGPMHIAGLSGVPALALMGPNYPYISGPLGSYSKYLFHEFPCSGCDQRGCDYSYRCINAISPDEVIAALHTMLMPEDSP